ncbi:MAG: DUF4339 domain-containing protein [Deltaproteobacteria bacterium]|nr:DUF4339 domain-containing protein [Deltaproteobacteria bacterium]
MRMLQVSAVLQLSLLQVAACMLLGLFSLNAHGQDDAVRETPLAPKVSWYTYINRQTQGPFSEIEMEKMVADGRITHYTMVAKGGTQEWMPAHTVFAFSTPLPPKPAPVQSNRDAAASDTDAYLQSKAKHVRAGNVMAAIGMIGAPLMVGVAVLTISESIDVGSAMALTVWAVGFGGLRIGGAITSAVAARRYTRTAGPPLFDLWPFWCGAGTFAIDMATIILMNNQLIGFKAAIGMLLFSLVARDVCWIINGVKARKATKEHRQKYTPAPTPSVVVAPFINPRSSSYGLEFGMRF